MNRMLVFLLLLCLILAGCEFPPVVNSTMETPSLPAPVPPGPGPRPGEETEVPILETPEDGEPTVRGPAGTVPARTFLGAFCSDPLYSDVDGDGETELIYRCPGPTSGLWTEAICVYGLEAGWPVLEGCDVFNLSLIRELGLEQEGNRVVLRCTTEKWDERQRCYVNNETLRLPVTLAEGEVLLKGGDLPKEIQPWGSDRWFYGSSFSALRERFGEEALLDLPRCLIWQQTAIQGLEHEEIVHTCAAVTDNGVTVTGVLAYEAQEDGAACVVWHGVEPIPAVEDPKALAGLTAEELEARLGPCHFSWVIGSGISYLHECWFTEDGKLLTVYTSSQAVLSDGSRTLVGLRDLTEGIPLVERDVVTVHQEAIPTQIENQARWEKFLKAVEAGKADGVILRLVYEEDVFELILNFDGEVCVLIDDGRVTSCRYLVIDRENEPSGEASFRRATHYLISDDPNMTFQQYTAQLSSSSVHPEWSVVRGLFSVYE